MPFNLLSVVKNLLDNDFVSRASNILGEDQRNVHTAVSAIIPSVVAGILKKTSSGDADEVLALSREATDSGVFSGVSNFLNSTHLMARGADFIKGIFGNRMSEVINAISGFANLPHSSVSSLLSFATPAALASLGKHAEENHMGSSEFLGFLNTQKNSVLNAVPPGFNLSNALGLTSLTSFGSGLSGESTFAGRASQATETIQRKKGAGWVLPALLILAGIALLWYLLGNRKHSDNTEAVTAVKSADTVVSVPASAPAPRSVHESVKVVLPDGVEINAYKGGIEDQLVAFLKDSNAKAEKNTWFDFDNLNFETGSANITQESMTQIQNITAILKAFPAASIKIGGYTDKTGDEPANMKLSQARADAVATALKTNGVIASQLAGAEGYGSQFAKVPETASDEERRIDRRIAVSPRKK